jgi:hypothetical protein
MGIRLGRIRRGRWSIDGSSIMILPSFIQQPIVGRSERPDGECKQGEKFDGVNHFHFSPFGLLLSINKAGSVFRTIVKLLKRMMKAKQSTNKANVFERRTLQYS